MLARAQTTLALIPLLVGCGGAPAECGDAQCKSLVDAAVSAATATPEGAPKIALSEFEAKLLNPLVEDLRSGVRPWNDEGIGICKGQRKCDEFLGKTVGDLPEGEYIVKAELRVPNIGEPGTWKVDFVTECTTTRVINGVETDRSNEYARTYSVRYAGPQHGYLLAPLRTIRSPNRAGKRVCKYKIVAQHPDGPVEYAGEWTEPPSPEARAKGKKGKGKAKGAKAKGAKGAKGKGKGKKKKR